MSAWRQPLLWLVLALPAATVVAGFTTLGLAAAGPDTSGDAAVKRTAQAQVEDLAPDLAALLRGLELFVLHPHADLGLELRAPLEQGAAA